MENANVENEPLRLTAELSLKRGRVHEVTGAAADSFAVIVAAKTSGSIVWIGRAKAVGTLTPMALCEFFDPARIVLIEGSHRKEVLWAAEQALRSKGAGLTVIQLDIGPDLIESRRLQLSAEQGGGLGLVLIGRRAQSSAAQTRWECQALPNANAANDSAKWIWELTKNKSGHIGRWVVTYPQHRGGSYGATRDVHMVAATAA